MRSSALWLIQCFRGFKAMVRHARSNFCKKYTHGSLVESSKRRGFASHSIVLGNSYLNCFYQWLCRQLSATNFQTLKQKSAFFQDVHSVSQLWNHILQSIFSRLPELPVGTICTSMPCSWNPMPCSHISEQKQKVSRFEFETKVKNIKFSFPFSCLKVTRQNVL